MQYAVFTRVKYATTLHNCWTRYPPRYSNGWAEFWSDPMKPLVNNLNHAHWLRISNKGWLVTFYFSLVWNNQKGLSKKVSIPNINLELTQFPRTAKSHGQRAVKQRVRAAKQRARAVTRKVSEMGWRWLSQSYMYINWATNVSIH